MPHVVDVRNCGLMAAIELEPRAGQPGKRAYEVFTKAFEAGVLIRVTGDTIALSPPLIVETSQIDQIFDCVGKMLRSVT
jgi:beta-alanine--pyruvate transaminase